MSSSIALSSSASLASATQNCSVPTGGALGDAQDLSTFIASLLPAMLPFAFFARLPDWVKLAVIGTVLETCRRLCSRFWSWLNTFFNLTVHFDSDDDSYDWVMFWLSQQSAFTRARDVEIMTRSWGSRPRGTLVPGEEAPVSEGGKEGQRELSYVPAQETTYNMWYKRRWMTVTRIKSDTKIAWNEKEKLEISIMTRNRNIVNALLLEAKRAYNAEQESTVGIYISDSYSNDWRHVADRPKRSMNSIVLDPGVKELVMDDAREFLSSRPWYAARGIPFRRGYLLHGAPGSGKTSLIHSVAGTLDLDVYMVSLSQPGMDDNRLGQLIADLPEKCIALMEDIDAAFTRGLNRKFSEEDNPVGDGKREKEDEKEKEDSSASRITLSGLLNALDGVAAQEGRLLFATTNRYSALDPALCRPGRMDIHVQFKLASRFQARELFRAFYMPDAEEKETKAEEKQDVNDSGYASASGSQADLIDLSNATSDTEKEPPLSQTPLADSPDHILSLPSLTHGQRLTPAQIDAMAHKFAAALPEREFSMAELQGYLMAFKVRANEAVEGVEDWVRQETEKKQRRKASKASEKKTSETKDDTETDSATQEADEQTTEQDTKEKSDCTLCEGSGLCTCKRHGNSDAQT